MENINLNDLFFQLLTPSINGKPNMNTLNMALRDLLAIKHNIKNFGYQLASEIKTSSSNYEVSDEPKIMNLKSKPTTQEDMESSWVKYWCKQLKIEPIMHRKIWELCYVPQALYENLRIKEGMKGIVFGAGEEPLPALFATLGADITVTDLHPDKVKGMGWAESNQHTNSLEKVFYENIIDKETFDKKVSLEYVDMNDIPRELDGKYDFCWSVCALEHLGSIQNGLNFIENSLNVLKPGGLAVHTTEYNYTNEIHTIDNWPTVFFQDKHFIELAEKLRKKGFNVADISFDIGNKPLDRYIDIPPYSEGEGWITKESWGNVNQHAHLKLSVDGFPCTSFGMIISKPISEVN